MGKWFVQALSFAHALKEHTIGLEEIADGIWSITSPESSSDALMNLTTSFAAKLAPTGQGSILSRGRIERGNRSL